MRLIIDYERCVGCGLCEDVLPEVFEIGRFTAQVTAKSIPDHLIDAAITVVEDCPAEALSAVK